MGVGVGEGEVGETEWWTAGCCDWWKGGSVVVGEGRWGRTWLMGRDATSEANFDSTRGMYFVLVFAVQRRASFDAAR